MTAWVASLTACCVAACGLLYWQLFCFTPGVSLANFERLHAGMGVDEIELVMGRPAEIRTYETRSMDYLWFGGDGGVIIADGERRTGQFQRGGEVVLELAPAPGPLLARLRRWSGL